MGDEILLLPKKSIRLFSCNALWNSPDFPIHVIENGKENARSIIAGQCLRRRPSTQMSKWGDAQKMEE
jgi:hypothetical protein